MAAKSKWYTSGFPFNLSSPEAASYCADDQQCKGSDHRSYAAAFRSSLAALLAEGRNRREKARVPQWPAGLESAGDFNRLEKLSIVSGDQQISSHWRSWGAGDHDVILGKVVSWYKEEGKVYHTHQVDLWAKEIRLKPNHSP
ncbi:uncharacterized protein LOC122024620 [Zingiber officinale]|uniref:uncharacterized protein LOC122024620 n=1 Tax=Zingiber officinale TaxID=94328 RepID=UPI001C4C2E5D|nr:uncharacterized protein LOC122024620 [Zingiber officinale]